MNEETQLNIMAFLDGELPDSERATVADLLRTDAEAAALMEELTWAKQTIAENEAEVTVPESREFYWSKIARGIELEEKQAARESRPSDKWWFKLLMPAGAFAGLMIAFTVINQPAGDPTGAETGTAGTMPMPVQESQGAEDVYTEASTYEFYAEDENMSVIWVTTDNAAEFESPTRDSLLDNQ